ncbi:MAG: rane protein [Chthoniobacter sp.]|nr:rane protein [Chthoniobacter sp.]
MPPSTHTLGISEPASDRWNQGPEARLVFIVLFCVTALKLAWAAMSAGSLDAVLFYNFARAIAQVGVCAVYPLDELFNHTPLTGTFALVLFRAAGGDYMHFAFLLRLVGTIADVAVVLGLLRYRACFSKQPPWWALVLFAASPVSLIVSGFHGNVDPVMIALLFFSGIAAVQRRPVWCGLLFGLACNVKIVPIMFAPLLGFFWLSQGRVFHFALPAAALLLAGSIAPLLACPREYLHNVFGYGSFWGVWGFPFLLRISGWAAVQRIDFRQLTTEQLMVAQILKVMVIGSLITLAWKWRNMAATHLPAAIGAAWIVFFVFAPGAAPQYMVWFAPFILLLSTRFYVALTGTSLLFLAVFYHSTSDGRFPWFFARPLGPETPFWSAFAQPVWFVFVLALIQMARARFRAPVLSSAVILASPKGGLVLPDPQHV